MPSIQGLPTIYFFAKSNKQNIDQSNNLYHSQLTHKVIFHLTETQNVESGTIDTIYLRQDVIIFVFSLYESHKEAINLATEMMKSMFNEDKYQFDFFQITSLNKD